LPERGTADSPVVQGFCRREARLFLVNNYVDNNPLSDGGSVLRLQQFIERAEMEGGVQQSAAGSFQDNPR